MMPRFAALFLLTALFHPLLEWPAFAAATDYAAVDSWDGNAHEDYEQEWSNPAMGYARVWEHIQVEVQPFLLPKLIHPPNTWVGAGWTGKITARISLDKGSEMVKGLGSSHETGNGTASGTATLGVDPKKGAYRLTIHFDTHITTDGTCSGPVPSAGGRCKGGFKGVWSPDQQILDEKLPDIVGLLTGRKVENVPAQGFSVTTTWSLRPSSGKLKAVAEVKPVLRGDPALFDGSRSTGRIVSYNWKLAPFGSCAIQGKQVEMEGATLNLRLLCPVKATLTVSDGSAHDSADVVAQVSPRPWKTAIDGAQEGTLNSSPPLLKKTGPSPDDLSGAFDVMVGGENDCALDDQSARDHTLHPRAESGGWDTKGYALSQIDQGPFQGAWYLSDYKLRVARILRINKYLVPGGPPPLSGYPNFYDANKKAGMPVDAYLKAIHDHEGKISSGGALGHEGLIEKTLPEVDPARDVEAMAAMDEENLKSKADERIAKSERTLCEKSADPLPEIWRGQLLFPLDDGTGYTKITTRVGGSRYGTRNCQ